MIERLTKRQMCYRKVSDNEATVLRVRAIFATASASPCRTIRTASVERCDLGGTFRRSFRQSCQNVRSDVRRCIPSMNSVFSVAEDNRITRIFAALVESNACSQECDGT